MNAPRSPGELFILHSLRDGDDPVLHAPATELIFFNRDVAQLVALGFVHNSSRGLALTIDGLNELSRPGNCQPPPWEACTRPASLDELFPAD